MYEGIKKRVFQLEESLIWEVAIIVSVILSVFGPSVAIIMDLPMTTIIKLIIWFNIIFFFDLFFKLWKYKTKYLYSIDFLIDVSAIISAILEFLTFTNNYSGIKVANLRVLRALKVLGRISKTTKSIINFGRINKLSKGAAKSIESGKITLIKKHVKAHFGKAKEEQKEELPVNERVDMENKEVKFLHEINAKMHTVLMILMTYIIIRFGAIPANYTLVQEAKYNIYFFIEIILIMVVIGGIIDYFLQKLIGERFENIKKWVRSKSQQHGFFQEVHDKAYSISKDEVSFLEQYIGIVLEKAAAFPVSFRKLIWGKFKPEEKKRIIFISDIETYSKITADMSPVEINNLLNEYINKIVEILVFYGAEVDKYVGDSIIVYFPKENADYVIDALMQISKLKFSYNLKTRIGINFGKVIETYVGPYGYKQMDHFSEEISITQRVEDYNKKTKSYLLMTESFVNLLSEEKMKNIKYHGVFKPKGANKKIKVYKHVELSNQFSSKK